MAEFNIDKHLDSEITVPLIDMRHIWSCAGDRTRLEILKSIIWTAPSNHKFYGRAMKILNSDKFQNTLD